MAQTPTHPQIQVIPHSSYSSAQLQPIYLSQQHYILPANVTLHHGGMGTTTMQGVGTSPSVNLAIQPKPPPDAKVSTVQNIQPYPAMVQSKSVYPSTQSHGLNNQSRSASSRYPQSSGIIYRHPQMLGSYALPAGYTFSSSSCYPLSQNPVIFSRDQPHFLVQSQPSQSAIHLPYIVSGHSIQPVHSHASQCVQTIATQTSAPSSLNPTATFFGKSRKC
ncbi:uncharacterized protein CEXT_807631 [Caerostris extrusa]|uniref:Uncharacterized protein n=1 Tax=Caerostris extrusa TaxID=172846 RepID=A0AAV4VY78_CAEEX|nr:uncharacterized protein CEXT_807631 [Caerostris extrusa]